LADWRLAARLYDLTIHLGDGKFAVKNVNYVNLTPPRSPAFVAAGAAGSPTRLPATPPGGMKRA